MREVALRRDQIQVLHDRYLELVRLEVSDLGVQPTEARHLIGRLGELHCALRLHGTLAHQPNQHGFDVIAGSGRRVSVKTTAQLSGFVAIAESTRDRAQDLMVVQYRDGMLNTLFYGPMNAALEVARPYKPSGCFELDLTKARRLADERAVASERVVFALEGGDVRTIDRNDEWLVVTNETALLDVLDPEDRDGCEAVRERAFSSPEARSTWLIQRGWLQGD